MSSGLSLQAARADNFYYPPEWDPSKGSLDKFHGQHPLRERAKKLDQGILVIRFEMPFNVWCKQCESLIGKGVRFNAEKKQIGNYLSTKIWSFTMRHHCGCLIEVQTDPKNAAYVITQGARQKEESWNAEEAGVIDLGGDDHRDQMAKDPLYAVEHKEEGRRRAEQNKNRLRELQRHSDERHRDDAALNRLMRGRARANRRSDKALDARRHAIGLPSNVKLLPTNEADGRVASMVVFGGPSDQRFATSLKRKRQDILSQRIFASSRKSSGAAGQGALKEKRKRMHPSVRLTAREPAASKASGGSS